MDVLFLIKVVVTIIICTILFTSIYQKSTNAICVSKKRLDGKAVLVTGGTAGMGLEIAKDFAQRGARVIVACPFKDEGLSAVETIKQISGNQNIVYKFLDLASFESTRALATDILKNEDRLNILVNNAGVIGPRDLVTRDGLNFVVQVNYFGAFLLTMLLLPLLKKSGHPQDPSRILNTTSASHVLGRINFSKLDVSFYYNEVYFNSKLFFVLFSRALYKRLQGSNVVANSVDPGAAGTNIFVTSNAYLGPIVTILFSFMFKTPWEGAQTALHAALDKEAGEVSGEYFKNCKRAKAAARGYDDELARKLFEESVRLVKLTNEELEKCF